MIYIKSIQKFIYLLMHSHKSLVYSFALFRLFYFFLYISLIYINLHVYKLKFKFQKFKIQFFSHCINILQMQIIKRMTRTNLFRRQFQIFIMNKYYTKCCICASMSSNVFILQLKEIIIKSNLILKIIKKYYNNQLYECSVLKLSRYEKFPLYLQSIICTQGTKNFFRLTPKKAMNQFFHFNNSTNNCKEFQCKSQIQQQLYQYFNYQYHQIKVQKNSIACRNTPLIRAKLGAENLVWFKGVRIKQVLLYFQINYIYII
eukprot:TRINITY_DN3616_c0_g1_i9.p1 TRINITY_DN3616_c0_g1~~TRINITY_DN3616_c0_g1_i9.p1  ORF type:complete len:259 (+),score=-25.96 TRINITY_DN3616_c0_g1_i9:799-1575(+)